MGGKLERTRIPAGIVEDPTESILYRTKSRVKYKTMIKPSPFEKSQFEWNTKATEQPKKVQGEVIPYQGPEGGMGCLDTATGKVWYGDPSKCGARKRQKKKPKYESPKYTTTKVEPHEDKPVRGVDELKNEIQQGVGYDLSICPPREDAQFKDPVSYVMAKGRDFAWMKTPTGIPKGKTDNPFINATELLLDHPEWDYAEGYAKSPQSAPTLHAWLVTKKGRPIDTTSGETEEISYVGVIYPREEYLDYIEKTGYYGVLGGNPENVCEVLRFGGIRGSSGNYGVKAIGSLYESQPTPQLNSSKQTQIKPKQPGEIQKQNKTTQVHSASKPQPNQPSPSVSSPSQKVDTPFIGSSLRQSPFEAKEQTSKNPKGVENNKWIEKLDKKTINELINSTTRYTKNRVDAEDAVSNIYNRIIRLQNAGRLPNFQSDADFLRYLSFAARNSARDLYRKSGGVWKEKEQQILALQKILREGVSLRDKMEIQKQIERLQKQQNPGITVEEIEEEEESPEGKDISRIKDRGLAVDKLIMNTEDTDLKKIVDQALNGLGNKNWKKVVRLKMQGLDEKQIAEKMQIPISSVKNWYFNARNKLAQNPALVEYIGGTK